MRVVARSGLSCAAKHRHLRGFASNKAWRFSLSELKRLFPLSRAVAFVNRIGRRMPILLAPMAGACPPSLSIAVANAGGLGTCGALLMTPEAIRAWTAEFRQRAKGNSNSISGFPVRQLYELLNWSNGSGSILRRRNRPSRRKRATRRRRTLRRNAKRCTPRPRRPILPSWGFTLRPLSQN